MQVFYITQTVSMHIKISMVRTDPSTLYIGEDQRQGTLTERGKDQYLLVLTSLDQLLFKLKIFSYS